MLFLPGWRIEGESKEKETMMKFCEPGSITRWGLQSRLTVLCRTERTTHRVRLILQVPSYDLYYIALHVVTESFITLQRAGRR